MIYQWKHYQFPIKAQDAGEELERIQMRDGYLVPATIVSEARPTDAVLHDCFEWKDDVAAEEYRKQQARVMLGNLLTVNVLSPDGEKEQRAFLNITVEKEPNRYMATAMILADADLRKQVLDKALSELTAFQKKYENLVEMAKVLDAIRELKSA